MGLIQRYNPLSGKFDFVSEEGINVLSYVALLSQTGTNAPTVESEVINTLGETLTWSYDSVGYFYTQSLLFTQDNMALSIQKDWLMNPTQVTIPDKSIFYDGVDAGGGYVSIYTQSSTDNGASYQQANGLLSFTAVYIYVKI